MAGRTLEQAEVAQPTRLIGRQRPYLLALFFSILVSAFIGLLFGTPPPRFMDLYLLGIVFFCARWSSGPGLLIYLFSVVFCWWLLPPRGAFVITEGYDVFRMLSYSAVAISIIVAIDYVKSRG